MAGEIANFIQVLPSAARTTTQTISNISVQFAAQIDVILNMTVVGTGSVTLAINALDPVSGQYYNLLTGAAVITNSLNVYKVGRALTAAANAIVNSGIPATLQIVVTANNANSATYSVGMNTMPV